MAVAKVLDVAKTLGRPISDPDEVAQIQVWLDGVELVIETRLGDSGELNLDVVKYVEAESVARRARNPEGKIQERIDDYSAGWSTESARAALYITDDEWSMLDPGGSTGGAYLPIMAVNPWRGCGRPRHGWPWANQEWS